MVSCPLPPIPHIRRYGFGRTDRTNANAADCQSYVFIGGVSPDWFPTWSKELEPRNLVSELFTQGSVGGAAGNCCLYPASRIATAPFFEVGCACGVTLVLKVASLARNRLILGIGFTKFPQTKCKNPRNLVKSNLPNVCFKVTTHPPASLNFFWTKMLI